MSFNDIGKIESYEFYLDSAIKKAKKEVQYLRPQVKGTRLFKSRKLEQKRFEIIYKVLIKHLELIEKQFPSFDDLDEFYKQLIKINYDIKDIKKSLGALNWARRKLSEFSRKYDAKINGAQLDYIPKLKKEFLGRMSSVIKQIKKDLIFLENLRKELKNFPTIKTGLTTVAIAGFPNVGKSTLLSKITTSTPEIKAYAFTTKKLNLGYFKHNYQKLQIVDTTGTLNRFEKMNPIEQQAYLAMKYVADVIIYVFDPTEIYDYKKQISLLNFIKKFDKKIIYYISKTDLITKYDKFEKFNPITNPTELKKELKLMLKN